MDAIAPAPAPATPARELYDPHYDPLTAPGPGNGRDYAPTYWLATAGAPPPDDGPIAGDQDVDVAIVGSGYTGLACALFLARNHGIKATVLEANRVAWGCSTRNGGQGQNAAGRLSRSQWIARWGEDIARRLHTELETGFETFAALVAEFGCDAQPGGHLHIAHRARMLRHLEAESAVCNKVFGYPTRMIGSAALAEGWVRDCEAVGALHEPLGIGVHPAKLAFGYLRAVRAAGGTVHPASPVIAIERDGGSFRLRTPGGVVRARAVALATGGYTSQRLHPALDSRVMPILSNALVTRTLSDDEIAVAGFRTRHIMTDTRTLRHYYRLLPDNRLQIGSRSAITGADAANPIHLRRLIAGMTRKFPSLAGIGIDYDWWGWVDVSHDMMPRIVQPTASVPLFYAIGYGGNGVGYSAQAGLRLASLIAGGTTPSLPIFQGCLPGHRFAPFRRLGQKVLYRYFHHRDERPDDRGTRKGSA